MSLTEAIFTIDFLIALCVYAIATPVCLSLFISIHSSLRHSFLQWNWDHIGMPLLRAGLMLIFIVLAYPVLFGLEHAPVLTSLFSPDEKRIHYLINLLFIVTLLFPAMPIIGQWDELILPLQGISATMLLFSWLADALQLSSVRYWPGLEALILIIIIAFIGHIISTKLALLLGQMLDERFNVSHSSELLAKSIIIFIQGPIILIFGLALGKQV